MSLIFERTATVRHNEEQFSQTPGGCSKDQLDAVDLMDEFLIIDIPYAQFEEDEVKFTLHTTTTLPEFEKSEFSVIRSHEEFIWLYHCLADEEQYQKYIIPPAPTKPDFEACTEKLETLREGKGVLTVEEYDKMKKELEVESLATFKKTVAMHELFLQRLSNHRVFRNDHNFKVFLEYDQDLSVRDKSTKEIVTGLFSKISKSADIFLLSNTLKDVDQFFENERNLLAKYHSYIKDATLKCDKMVKDHKNIVDSYNKISSAFKQLATMDEPEFSQLFIKISKTFEKTKEIEGRVASDEDLKLSDTLRYLEKDTEASKDLLYRRLRYLVNYETANRNLRKAIIKNKDIDAQENIQKHARQRFETISEEAKQELQDFNTRRILAFRKNLRELAKLELKQSKTQELLLQSCLMSFCKQH